MTSQKEYMAGWINTTINDFLEDIDEPTQAMTYALITCLDSNPDVSSIFHSNKDLRLSKMLVHTIGQGVVVPTRKLIAANRRQRIFFGFDEIWFFPGAGISPKPPEFVITRPHPIDMAKSNEHISWMISNKCSLGLGDGEGMNYCLKIQGTARYVVRAFNEAMADTAG